MGVAVGHMNSVNPARNSKDRAEVTDREAFAVGMPEPCMMLMILIW
jgi:hypothetical protein